MTTSLLISRILSPFTSTPLTEELSYEIESKQREVIQNEIEQIKMNHRVMCSKAILAYLSRIAAEIAYDRTQGNQS